MFEAGTPDSILVVRMGAMGDVIHALPAVMWLRRSFPQAHLAWLIERRWSELLQGNPAVDELVALDGRGSRAALAAWKALRRRSFSMAVDFQGLLKSAAPPALAGCRRRIGFARPRERAAAIFYTQRVETRAAHVVDQNLELAASAGAKPSTIDFPLPSGTPEGSLPEGRFVLASPLAGWQAKQWPLERYSELAELLARRDVALVLNGPPAAQDAFANVGGTWAHASSLAGLIDATRRAAAVVGVDSGPLHLAAALGKPGVAIFGLTDPARNGPYGASFTTLRSPRAVTSYKRGASSDHSMQDISAVEVFAELWKRL